MAFSRSTALGGAILSALLTSVLAACAAAPAPAPSPSVTAEPAPSATPSASPSSPPDELFTVSATVRAVDGTSIRIELVGRMPVPSTDPKAAPLARSFVDACSAISGRSVSDAATPVSRESLAKYGSSLMRIDYAAKPEGHTFFAPIDLSLGSLYFPRVATGDGLLQVASNATCLGQYQLTRSGSGAAITNYESGAPAPDPEQWRYGHYGFSVPLESGATIEACKVVVTELAAKKVADVPGWEQGSDRTATSCGVGYRGE